MRNRGFEVVRNDSRKFPNNNLNLPLKGSKYSAGYDFYSNEDVYIDPNKQHVFWTDINSYMLEDEVLEVFVRSSIALKKGLELKNQVGIIDMDYYQNIKNDGNIGVCLYNPTNKQVRISKDERIAQGIFHKYLVADNDVDMDYGIRTGGIGSTNK